MATSFYSGSGLTTTEQDSIESSIAAAEAAKAAAEAAKVAAETAETNAETAEVNSETAKVASEAAQASAETAEANALASSSSASTSATQSAASATSSASSAASASSSSSSSASSAASASTAQTASETAQAAAEAALDDFTDAYLGAKTSDPSLDNDNNALIDGALYFNTTDNVIKVYDLGTTSWTAIALSASDSTNLATVSGQISPTNNLATVAGDSADISTVAGISSDVSTVAADTTDIGTVAGISANVTTVAGISSDVTTVAADATDIGTVAGISANVTTVAGDSTNIGTVATNISNVNAVAGNATSINTVAADGTDIGTVAGISSDISTVAADGADIGTVAGISSDVTTVASISANTTTVAGISSDVTSVAGVSSDVTTVAGISSNVTTVAGDSTDIQTVASNITGVNSFADRYQVGTTNPTTSLDAGDLFFNTTDDELKVYNGSAWSTGVTTGNATQSSDGLMSSADKTKLDGVEASADVTDTTNVVAALTGGTNITIANDGTISASGGDITVQDEGSSLATAATALNFTGTGVTASGTGASKTINITDTNTTYSNATTSAAGLMSSSDKTKIDGIATGATNVTNTNQLTNGAGFITSADGGNAATLDGIDSTSFLRSDATDTFTNLSGTSVTLGSGVTLQESTDRADLLQITSTTSGWGGLQIRNSSDEGRWSFMTDGSTAGIYDDQSSHWHITMVENSYTNLYYDNVEKLRTLSGGVGVTGLTVGDVDANPHNSGGLNVSMSNDEKIVLSGTTQPYIRWQEGTTDKFYIQWLTGGYPIFRNQEGGNFQFRPNGTTTAVNIQLTASDGDLYGSVYGNHSNQIGFLDQDGNWAYRHTRDSLHEFLINNTVEMSLSTSTLDMKGNTITEVEDIGLRDRLYHDGDTNTYLEFDADQINMTVGGSTELYVNTTGVRLGDSGNGYFQPVSGNYGSIQIDGGAHGGYEGYSIGGRVVLMHNNSTTTGIYNDVDNEWLFRAIHNGSSYLYNNGTAKVEIGASYMEMSQRIDMNNYDIYGCDQLFHHGDTNTYMQFHAADQWRVVTGGTERLEVNNSQVTVAGNLVVGGTISGGGAGVAYFANIDGTGTVNLRRSSGMSSVTDSGTGNYNPNLSPTLASANHAPVSGGAAMVGSSNWWQCWGSIVQNMATNTFRIYCAAQGTTGAGLGDWDIVTCVGNV
jgi:hypothetical protein